MNWDILDAYIETLIEMIMTGDHTGWEAIRKYWAFSNDIRQHYEIIEKKENQQ